MKAGTLVRIALSAGLVLAEALVLAVPLALVPGPASAQFWDPFYRPRPPRAIPQQQPSFNPFGGGGLFDQPPPWQQQAPPPPRPPRVQISDFSKAPPPRKPDTPPTTSVVVLGDAMADWLGHGLEEALADNAEFGVVRKIRSHSGLIRNEQRTDSYDWVQSARDQLANEKPAFVVFMLGLSDRVQIRERAPARPAAGRPGQPAPAAPQPQPAPPPPPAQGQQVDQQNAEGPTKPEQPAAEPAPAAAASPTNATHEFRSDKWGELYGKRIDDMIAVLKSKGVPVLWVGLPPIRGPKARADLTYLNDLFRARAQKAGIIFVDVWDGFVDEDGNFSPRGPDYNGQVRVLRAADGVYFTKPGALKLGHYVEREIQRLMVARATPVALPAPEPQPQAPAKPGAPAPRPVAGPVVPLTAASAAPEELAGSNPVRGSTTDPVAMRVLVRGEAQQAATGRADDFSWPRQNADDAGIIPASVTPAAPAPTVQRPARKGQQAQAEKTAPKRPGGQTAAPAQAPAPAVPARR
jgi:uncharacterized protein